MSPEGQKPSENKTLNTPSAIAGLFSVSEYFGVRV